MTSTIYRDYWASAPEASKAEPDETYATRWVKRMLEHEAARRAALRAQWIERNATY